MRSFEYIAPTSVSDALDVLERLSPTAKLMAGGTDLLVQMKIGDLNPRHLIDLKKIPQLSRIKFDQSKNQHIGSLATVSEIQ